MSESADRAAWEWSSDDIRRIGHRVVDLIADHLTGLGDGPVFRPVPRALAARFVQSAPPDRGRSPEAILDAFATEIAPYPFGNGHPRFFGWVNSPPAVMGIFADALAAAMNPSCAGGNHAAIYVERQVIDWFRQIAGFPAGAMGLLVSGGSMAALTALAVARHVRCGFDVRARGVQSVTSPLVFYRSGEGHGCHQKAIELMGIGHDHLRTIAHDSARRMVPAALADAIRDDRASGRTPIAVIASVGTVNTGAIDPLDEIAGVCREHGVWLHVDGAYGAPAVLSTEYAHLVPALARADSLALDPHKWLSVPVEAGLVLVRDGAAMRSAFSLVPPYLWTDGDPEGVGGLPWLSEYGYQQTRGFRALKVWMALQHHGLDGYRMSIGRDLDHARRLASAIRSSTDFELLEPQGLGIVCFRHRAAADANKANQAILERVQLGGELFLSSTVIDDVFWLRACFVNPRTREGDVDAVLEIVRRAAPA
jgi:glutamate/tyrosine decarboxylase-like PLP-dependent enzyme